MQPKNTNYEHCSLARVLEHVGEWYTILILRDAMQGLTRFDDFQKSLGMSPNTLSKRLQGLVDSGLLQRCRYNERPPRDEYLITECGREFLPVVVAMIAYGNKYFSPEGLDTLIIDKKTNQQVKPLVIDAVTGNTIHIDGVIFAAGPDSSPEKRKRFNDLGFAVLDRI